MGLSFLPHPHPFPENKPPKFTMINEVVLLLWNPHLGKWQSCPMIRYRRYSGRSLTFASWEIWGFPGGSDSRESTCHSGDRGSIPGSGRSLGKGNATLVFLPGEFHGKRSLAGYSPWGHKKSDMTEQLTLLLISIYSKFRWKYWPDGTQNFIPIHFPCLTNSHPSLKNSTSQVHNASAPIIPGSLENLGKV